MDINNIYLLPTFYYSSGKIFYSFGSYYALSKISIYDVLKPNYGDRTAKVTPNEMFDELVYKFTY